MCEAENWLEQEILSAIKSSRRVSKWKHGRFRDITLLGTTERGDLAEHFAVWLGCQHGLEAKRHDSRRAEWDVVIGNKKVEVKMASEDVSGHFQFNGIRYDTKYDLLLVIGFSPNSVMFNIYPRKDLMDMSLTRMAKGTNATYKLTRKVDAMLSVDKFADKFATLLGGKPNT